MSEQRPVTFELSAITSGFLKKIRHSFALTITLGVAKHLLFSHQIIKRFGTQIVSESVELGSLSERVERIGNFLCQTGKRKRLF